MKEIKRLIYLCATATDSKRRMKLARILDQRLNEMENQTNSIIEKAIQAAQTISDQNDLLECFRSIDPKAYHYVINTWKTLKDKRNKKED